MNDQHTKSAVIDEQNQGSAHDDRSHPIPIHIDGRPYQATSPRMTGAEIKNLGGVPGNYQLFLEVPGPDPDRGIRDDEVVEMRPGMHFYSVPAGTLGAGAAE